MRRLLIPLLALSVGCQASRSVDRGSWIVDREEERCTIHDPPSTIWPDPLDLPGLWNLTLANNPALREAAAEVGEAQGRLIQAGKYPNPRVAYSEEDIGTKQAPAGSVVIQVNQEIVTGGKRRLDIAIAREGMNAAQIASLGRQFDVLTRVRRVYHEYLGWSYTLKANERIVASLEKSRDVLREHVEVVKDRPRVDLVRAESLLEEARINQERSRASLDAARRQLAAEVGVPTDVPVPEAPSRRPDVLPHWDAETVLQRVLMTNSDLKQAAIEAERARLEVDRARAEAVPNVTLGGGFARNFAEDEIGGVVSVEMSLPVWDRKQGRIREAEAHWARAEATLQTTANRLRRDTAEAFGRYQAALRQENGLRTQVIPRLEESARLVRESYEGKVAQITFADVLLAEQALNEALLHREEARRELWRAVADLQGLMQLDIGEEMREEKR
jgi:cobalt-zinc-cadmium efflux system outer membrane protein